MQNTDAVGKICDHRPVTQCVSEMVQDKVSNVLLGPSQPAILCIWWAMSTSQETAAMHHRLLYIDL